MVFELFRRRQRAAIAVLAVFAMFAFVLAGAIDRFIYRDPGNRNPTLATAFDEPIKASEVMEVQSDRRNLAMFLEESRRFTNVNKPLFQWSPLERDVYFGLQQTRESDAIRALVLLEKADRLGIVVTNDDISEFIDRWTEKRLSSADFNQILSGRSGGSGKKTTGLEMTDRDLYRALGREIRLQRLLSVVVPPVPRDAPMESWEKKAPLLTRVKLDVVNVPADKFIDKVPEPSDAELRKIYDEYKAVTPNPTMGIIGLREPRRVDVQYLAADVTKAAEKITVTDEEIAKYYEEHKDEFRRPPERNLPLPPGSTPPPPVPASKPSETKESPANENAPAEEPKPETNANVKPESKAAENPESTTPAPQPKTEPSTTPAPAPEPPKPEGKSSLPAVLQSIVGSAVYYQPPADQSEPAAAPPAAKTEEPKTTIPPPAPPKEEPKPAEKPAEAKPAAEEKPAVDVKSAPPPASTAGAESKPADPSPVRPLAEVREEIVKKLKQEKAAQQVEKELKALLNEVFYPYAEQYVKVYREAAHQSAGTSGDIDPAKLKLPPPPDYAAIAKEHGFELKSTGMVSFEEAAKLPNIGQAVATSTGMMAGETFASLVFDDKPGTRLFRTRMVRSADESTYFLFWKTKDVAATIPSFEDVKPQVLAIWKQQASGPLALAEAKKLAEAIRNEKGDIAKAVPESLGFPRSTTDLFPRKRSGFTTDPGLGSPRLEDPEVPQLPDLTPTALDTIFKMKVGDVEVVSDRANRNHFIVKLLEREIPDMTRFLQEYQREARTAGMSELMMFTREGLELRERAIRDILTEANLVMNNRAANLEMPVEGEPLPDEMGE